MAPDESFAVQSGLDWNVKHAAVVLSACQTDAVRTASSRILSQLGLVAREAESGQHAAELLDACNPDLILLEADADGREMQACRRMRAEQRYAGSIGVWINSPFPPAQLAEWLESGATVFLSQASDDAVLLSSLRCLLRAHESEREVAAVRAQLALSQGALRLAQQEFQHFARRLSHDFQESARVVTAFCQLIDQDRNHAPAHEQEYLNLISGASQRIRDLLDGVLAYAQAVPGNQTVFGLVDLTGAAQNALGDLHEAVGGSGAHIDLSPSLPVVWASLPQIQLVLRSLIGNSIKYRQPGRPPEIQIDANRASPEEWAISVRDNGIGIPAHYLESVFVPFKRLHGREIPGSGMGLAVCRRIVEAHGGRIWAESLPGEGSRFQFTLREAPVLQPAA